MSVKITCYECDCETEVGFVGTQVQLERRCSYCGSQMPHIEIVASNLVATKLEAQQTANALVFALRAFAATIEKDVPNASALLGGVLTATAKQFQNGPFAKAVQ